MHLSKTIPSKHLGLFILTLSILSHISILDTKHILSHTTIPWLTITTYTSLSCTAYLIITYLGTLIPKDLILWVTRLLSSYLTMFLLCTVTITDIPTTPLLISYTLTEHYKKTLCLLLDTVITRDSLLLLDMQLVVEIEWNMR